MRPGRHECILALLALLGFAGEIMKNSKQLRRWAFLAGAMLGWPAAGMLSAADLRVEVGDRPLVRSVSYVADEEPPVSALKSPPKKASSGAKLSTARRGDHSARIEHPGQVESLGFVEDAAACGGCGTCDACTTCDAVCWSPLCGMPYWASVEFLTWWASNPEFPTLVTTSPNGGVLPGATALFGGSIDQGPRPGGRFDAGLWCDQRKCLGAGVSVFALGTSEYSFATDSSQFSLIARPYFDSAPGQNVQDAFIVANGTATPGAIQITGSSDIMGGDVYLRRLISRGCRGQLDLLVGYQAARIEEDITIFSTTGTQAFEVTDYFATNNEYHAAFFGLDGQWQYDSCWSVRGVARFCFGNMQQEVDIRGMTNGNPPNSGLLAQSATNAGLHTQDEFSYMQDLGIMVGYQTSCGLKLTFGYSLLYWSSVVRPGEEMDTSVDGRLLPPQPVIEPPAVHPAFNFNPTSFFVQGMNFGAEFSY